MKGFLNWLFYKQKILCFHNGVNECMWCES